ncbi:MAG: hypothetical protein QXZ18_01325 [Thermoplasmata archaeon]
MDKVQRIIASIDRISFTFIALKLLAIWGSLLSYGEDIHYNLLNLKTLFMIFLAYFP